MVDACCYKFMMVDAASQCKSMKVDFTSCKLMMVDDDFRRVMRNAGAKSVPFPMEFLRWDDSRTAAQGLVQRGYCCRISPGQGWKCPRRELHAHAFAGTCACVNAHVYISICMFMCGCMCLHHVNDGHCS